MPTLWAHVNVNRQGVDLKERSINVAYFRFTGAQAEEVERISPLSLEIIDLISVIVSASFQVSGSVSLA